MPSDSDKYDRLVELLTDVMNLGKASTLLFWDQQTMMPKGGAQARGDHLATVEKVVHERFTSPEIGQLVTDLRDYELSLPYDSDEASLIRVTRREYEQATRLPVDLVARIARAGAEGYEVWLKAREANDYGVFRPALERIYGLMREAADALGWEDHPLDALLDRFEPGMKAAEMETLFGELRAGLVPLCQAISARAEASTDRPVRQDYPHDSQLLIAREAARAIGFDLETRGRLDLSVHPFTTSLSPDDARITTKIDVRFLGTSLFASLHEAGHGTYEQGLPSRFRQSTLGNGASGGIHESQSLLWENVVGRSRSFWQFFYPRLQTVFPAQLGQTPLESFYRAVNTVKPSLIRVDADEVTYNLHIMIRFELEKAVFDGELDLADLAEAWKVKFQHYLGLRPPDDLSGVLQDIHWSGDFGASFASYTVGHVAGLQFYEAALRDIPDLEAGFTRGEFAPLLEWMNRKIHAEGAKFRPAELVQRVTGRPLETGPYLSYIKRKFGELYGL